MKRKILLLTLTALILAGNHISVHAQDAEAILNKVDEVVYASKDMTATNTLIIIDKNGKEETRIATVKQKGNNMRIMRYLTPPSQAGIAVLSLPNDVMYLYLPAYGKERRISASIKNQNFAGTDFSYYDMESKSFVEKYTPRLIDENNEFFILELVPKERSDYSKVLAYVNKVKYYPEKMEYFDRGNNKIKVANYTFEKIGNYWNANEIEMVNLTKDHRTKMRMTDVVFDSGLNDDEFTVRNLVK